ncbi:inositol monophosphatase [Candidatus Microgenomates bacterium]|nr:inositol monophosphatase [Candidatus Microgenomates bacterium]
MTDELKVAIEAARIGAKVALKYYDKNIEVIFKENDKTPVTIADYESEKAIKSFILKRFPSANIVAEESGGSTSKDEFWTVDPIDGTRSFARGIPGWCVLISFFRKEVCELGVCHFPIFEQTLYAKRGGGAYLNNKRVHVSKIDTLNKAYFGFGNPKHTKKLNAVMRLVGASASTRSWEVTYAAFLLSQGKVDIVYDEYAQIWDRGPFCVIVEEAGGKITNLQGKPLTIEGRGYIATNGLLHDEVIRVLNH